VLFFVLFFLLFFGLFSVAPPPKIFLPTPLQVNGFNTVLEIWFSCHFKNPILYPTFLSTVSHKHNKTQTMYYLNCKTCCLWMEGILILSIKKNTTLCYSVRPFKNFKNWSNKNITDGGKLILSEFVFKRCLAIMKFQHLQITSCAYAVEKYFCHWNNKRQYRKN